LSREQPRAELIAAPARPALAESAA
jgi:hypothetical protein